MGENIPDRFLPSSKSQESYIILGKKFLSGILNSGYGLQFEGYIKANYLLRVFNRNEAAYTPMMVYKSCLGVGGVGGDRLTLANQGI